MRSARGTLLAAAGGRAWVWLGVKCSAGDGTEAEYARREGGGEGVDLARGGAW